mmetsp:Transcript_90339/g.255444  ORF Transcript_90339/g.255444 Transcript_90339/m.255444 type:complete len:278 (+) Transcript_90339:57-890(+)
MTRNKSHTMSSRAALAQAARRISALPGRPQLNEASQDLERVTGGNLAECTPHRAVRRRGFVDKPHQGLDRGPVQRPVGDHGVVRLRELEGAQPRDDLVRRPVLGHGPPWRADLAVSGILCTRKQPFRGLAVEGVPKDAVLLPGVAARAPLRVARGHWGKDKSALRPRLVDLPAHALVRTLDDGPPPLPDVHAPCRDGVGFGHSCGDLARDGQRERTSLGVGLAPGCSLGHSPCDAGRICVRLATARPETKGRCIGTGNRGSCSASITKRSFNFHLKT